MKEKTLEFAQLKERKPANSLHLLLRDYLLSYLPIFFASKDIRLYPSEILLALKIQRAIHFLLHYAINYNSPVCLPF